MVTTRQLLLHHIELSSASCHVPIVMLSLSPQAAISEEMLITLTLLVCYSQKVWSVCLWFWLNVPWLFPPLTHNVSFCHPVDFKFHPSDLVSCRKINWVTCFNAWLLTHSSLVGLGLCSPGKISWTMPSHQSPLGVLVTLRCERKWKWVGRSLQRSL